MPKSSKGLIDIYISMPTEELEDLKRAFERDMKNGADEWFCKTRLSLIENVLKSRHKEK